MTTAEIRSLPATIDLVTAGRVFGVGRTKAYQLARTGDFPCRVLRVGRSYRVPTADLLAALGVALTCPDQATGGQPEDSESA
ncbi:helix-turn-helix domain-containing protein [Actinomadura algeriensis]|uniref:Helix-turn-helix domain-containing protein n=1 Tax=Actinomadura algeriensis TaxID=1679523 RepID=A0ABR9JRS1_9ACTN|nr:helix-turn-helix domain-containing protein [Actinomadura algeriensis]MBE1533262.1 hypothetical protein [Actinomadura algeriensis]